MRTVTVPDSVREWNRQQRANARAARDHYGAMDLPQLAVAIRDSLTSPTPVPANVAADYAAYVNEWNAAAAEHNAQVAAAQAARRAAAAKRTADALRASACTRCFSTHPGEC